MSPRLVFLCAISGFAVFFALTVCALRFRPLYNKIRPRLYVLIWFIFGLCNAYMYGYMKAGYHVVDMITQHSDKLAWDDTLSIYSGYINVFIFCVFFYFLFLDQVVDAILKRKKMITEELAEEADFV